ncbi:MAG: class I SAM-dependent methyltransferase [Pseudobutyrivibrio sp.]|nr:class I SAM-dependent methyltransferase [Pseudobutyrivibrio sp.]
MIKLSPRLQIVYDMIPHCQTVADVGTDHGYLPIALLENKVASRAIAMDINAGPLDRAKDNIKAAGFESQVDLRLSNGLEKLSPGEAEVISICGMGGTLIGKIFQAGEPVAKSADCIVIEPQSDYYSLRRLLMEMGFKIIDENLTCEENKIYPIIKLKYEADESKRDAYTDEQLEYGPKIIERAPELLYRLLDKNQKEYSSILASLESGASPKSEAIEARCQELRHQLQIIEQVRNLL